MNGIKRLALSLIVFAAAVLPARMMAGPKVSVIGDSYSTYVNMIPSGYANYYTGGNNFVTSVNQQYWMRVVNVLGGSLEVVNAYSGSFLTLQSNNAASSMIGDARLSNLGDPDLILICAATNDSWQDLTIGEPVYHENLGDYTAEEKAQIAPAFCYLIKYLQTNKPGAEIMLVINSYDDGENRPGIKKTICDVQAEVAQHYGVMAVQCHDIRKANNHPDAEGFYTMSEQILEVYRARHRTEELVPASEYEQLATSDDPSMRVVRTEEGLAYVFTDASSAKTFTVQKDLVVLRSLVVGGGGAGGWTIGGGGAGGAVKDVRMAELPANGIVRQGETISIQVGAGGANPYAPDLIASNTAVNRILPGGNGGNSVLTFAAGSVTALGGGGGGSWGKEDGVAGGNGGGAAAGQYGGSGALTLGVAGKGTDGGYDGGACFMSGTYDTCAPGGGAGAGGKGGDASSGCAGNGGPAVMSDILGYNAYYGGGGSGGRGNKTLTPGVPGINAGAGAEETAYIHGRSGLAGFGGGGGGGGYNAANKIDSAGGEGGSGTVILLVHERDVQSPSVSVASTRIECEAVQLTLTLENAGEGATSADLYFGFAPINTGMPQLTKVAEGVTAGTETPYEVSDLLSSHTYRYWCLATNDLQKGSIIASGLVTTDSLIPGGIVTYSDNLIATTVAETDFDVIQIDEFRRAYVFRNTQEGKLAMLAPAKLARLLLVGGGAAGGTTMGGGGGGGEVKEIDLTDAPLWMAGDLATFTIGAGGAPSNTGSAWNGIGGAGGTTTLSFGEQNYSAIGGGGGASFKSTTVGSGASGGGAAGTSVTVGGVGTAGTNGGNRGKGSGTNDYSPGGGGGAASAGLAGVGAQAGAGGEGQAVNITGPYVVYGSGGGGGGGNNVSPGLGGTNGGAGGGKSTDTTLDVSGQPGVDGTGSGGGGGGYNSNSKISHLGGKGGDGTVIFLFLAEEDPLVKYVEQPAPLGDEAIQHDGLAHAPNVEETEDYTVILSAGDWTQVGVYTVTLSLKDKENAKWSDGTTADYVYYTLTINPHPLDAIRPASYTGPKIAIIGDSYSAFPGSVDESHDSELKSSTVREYWYPAAANGVEEVSQMWWYQTIHDLNGYFVCNDSWSGTALCEYSWGCVYGNPQTGVAPRQMCNRLGKTLPTEVEPDVVLLLAGTNDAWIRYDQNSGATSGASVIDAFIGETWADPLAKPANHGANMVTMKPGFAQTVWWIREKFPHAKIMFIANKDEKISDNFSAALEEMAKVTGCKFLQLDVSKIAKISGHPTAAGMTNLSQQVTAAYRAWANDGFAIDGLEAMGEEVEGVPTASGDAQIGRLNTDYGYLRVVENSSRHYAVMVVTNTAATYEIELPAGKTNEYLVVGGGGSGGAVNNGTFAGAGGGAAVREGFHRWSGTDPVTLSVTVGAPGTSTGSGTGGKGGTTKIELSDGTPFIYADGGGAGGNWQQKGGDSEGSGGGGGSGNNERTLGGKHIGSSWLLGSDGGNGNNDSEANRSCIPGGGGGAGGPGGNSTKTVEGAGGPGVVRHITGSPVEYAAGGLGTRTKTISAAVSTGSGGSSYLGAGGSGIAAFRYELTDEEYASLMETVPHLAAKPALGATEVIYDGTDFKPGFTDDEVYTVLYSANQWIDAGSYTVTFHLCAGYTWEDDGSTEDYTLTLLICKAENEWTTAPSISKSSWLEKVDEPGVITAAAKYGEVQILYPGLATEMPTIPGDYIATVSVEATDNWLGLEVEIPFTITMNGAARTPVTVPEVPPAGTVPYDESNHKPTVVGTDAYTVTMTEGEWIEPGVYYLTLALTDPDNTMWADETVQNRVYAYIIKQGPTMTTGTRVEGTTVVESWGETYVLYNDKSGKFYQIVVVTNAGVDANWTVPAGVQVEYLLIGGGGGGGGSYNYAHGGGGGAGGVLADFIMGFDTAQVVVLNVGAGGTSGANADGKDTVLKCGGEIILNAPGGGGCSSSSAAGNSSSGGSGAGGASSGIQSGGLHLEGTGPAAGALGHNGAASKGNYWSGGGGGAGGDGGVDRDGGAHKEGNGGIGLDFGITGEIVGYAGGGAGDGGIHSHGGGEYGKAATANTGGGGGGGGGTGASGIAVLRYEIAPLAHMVKIPEELASQEFAYTGESRKPSVEATGDYAVEYSAGDWTDPGIYTLTLSLTDKENSMWSDLTTQDRVYVYTIKALPTTTTATRIDGTTLVETWGESYQVLDEVTGKRFQIVKVTNTASAATWTVPAGVFVEYLVVGGGGAGGWTIGGGGGGGGVIADVLSPLAEATEFTMTVGAGGDPKASTANWPSGGNGEGSSLSFKGTEIQTHGGGGGAGWTAKTAPSGGASSGGNAQGSGTIVATTLYEGEMGNQGGTSSGRVSGGGGGAMEAGTNGSSVPGKGGEGYAGFITGERVVYGSGGGGGLEGSTTANRANGGTNGGQGGYANVVGEDAVANTGSGGGGGGYSAATHGGAGASGIVVIRYKVANVVDIPEGLASQEFAYTGESLKPSVETTDDYTIEYSVGDWTSVGAYTVTLSLKDTENSIWADDESVTNKVFTYAIVKAVNSWTLAPSISKAAWRESEEAGVITAAAKFGVVTIDYGATGAVMPTAVGEYVAHLAVEGNDDYSALAAVEVPFKIVADDAKLEIQVPGVYADTSRPYDATSCRPADVSTEQYTVSFEDANWTDAGAYTVTVALTDKARSIWADSQTAEDKVFTYTITRAANSWMEAPAISSASWVVGKTPGIISAEPKWGNVVISFGASGSTMPTDAGEYVAQVSVQATENWEGLGPVAVPFEILGKPILGRALRVVSTEKSGGKYSSFTLSLDDKNMPGSLYIAYGDVKGGLTTNGWEQVAKVGDYEGGVAYNQIVANLPAGLGTDYRYFRFIFVPSAFDPSIYAAQEDLIAFWDGVLNDGPGNPHADAPAAWTDIIGGKPFTFSATKPEALANGFRFTGSQTGSMTSEDTAATFAQAVEGTVEAAFKRSERSQYAAVLQGPVSTGISLCWLDYDKVMAGCTSGSKYCPTLSPGTGFFVTSADYSNKLATNICVNGGAVYLIGSSYLTGITTTTALLANRGTGQPYQFKGDIYAIRLYRRPLTDEERQLNAHLDQFRYNGKEDELATATAVYNAGYVVELPNEVILSASYANWGATSANNVPMADNALVGITPTGSADWQYTEKNYSTTTWTDGNLTTYGTQVKNGATMTYEFPMERSVYEFRWYVASWSGRDRISIKSLVVEDAAGNKTALYPQSFDYTSAGNKYVVFASSDGRPIAVHAKRLMLTYGTGQNNGTNIAELEARCSDEVAVGTIERVPMSVGGYLTDGISGQVSPVATRVVVRYSTDQYEVESADCPSVEVTPGADGRFSVALADMAKGVQVYVRVVAMNAETLANSSVLAFVSSSLLLAGEGGRMYFAADGSGEVVHEFTSVEEAQTFVAPAKDLTLTYLLVGGGGSGATGLGGNPSWLGHGGKGGAVVEGTIDVDASSVFSIVVGAGGASPGLVSGAAGITGGDSSFTPAGGDTITAAGGAGGLQNKNNTQAVGADGTASSVSGVETYYGGGGGDGGVNNAGVAGGLGGGGAGANYNNSANVTAGTDGLGGGGGGGDNRIVNAGGKGGKGIVLIRYTPPVPPVVFKLVERGPGFLRVECVINELDAPSAELSIASGADAEHLGAYQQCSAAAVAGDAFTNTVVGLNAATDWTFSAKVVTTAGTKYYTGVFTTTEAIASAVPTLADAAVAIPDAASGTVEASAFVAWGGEKSAKCELVLKYGKVSGTYTKERVISAADIGTIRSTTTLTKGIWYAVLVARSSEGESAVSQEFELYSTKPRKSMVFYLK